METHVVAGAVSSVPRATRLRLEPYAGRTRTYGSEGAGPRQRGPATRHIPYSGAAPGFQCGLLVRRSIAKPTELTIYLTHAPTDTSLVRLVQIAGLRWPIESLFEQSKGEVGLDQYEVRSWIGWHRHITLAMFALAYLAAVRKDAIGGCGPAQPRRRAVAAHRARGQTPALGAGQPEVTTAALRPALVGLAPEASATRPACPLAPTNTAHAA